MFDPRIALPYPLIGQNHQNKQRTHIDSDEGYNDYSDNRVDCECGSLRNDCSANNGNVDVDVIIGNCIVCGTSYDDYSRQARCCRCRMLVLLCDECAEERASSSNNSNIIGDVNDTAVEVVSVSLVHQRLNHLYCGGCELLKIDI